MIRRLSTSNAKFYDQLDQLTAWSNTSDTATENTVADILVQVEKDGDKALIQFTNKFDQRSVDNLAQLKVLADDRVQALASMENSLVEALRAAADRIESFHKKQLAESWQYVDNEGVTLGQKVTPLERVGVYVPGGKAAYPSTALMNIIPAQVAGVKEIVMVCPCPKGQVNQTVLAAAELLGVKEIYTVGGAQAIAALAYGTESIKKVDKIVGPGNRFVAAAKQKVFGRVGLDMVAGPSEILVVCDGKTDPDWIAMDLFSQAEHDEDAQAILISQDESFLDQVAASIEKLLPTLERKAIIEQSIRHRGALIKVEQLEDAITLINRIAPEHLELSIADAEQWLSRIDHAGAIFVGRYTPEAFGDYCAGPNHVLPTSATARFASPLGVYDFQKRSSIINCSAVSAKALSAIASPLARAETLTAHALSAEMRDLNK